MTSSGQSTTAGASLVERADISASLFDVDLLVYEERVMTKNNYKAIVLLIRGKYSLLLNISETKFH